MMTSSRRAVLTGVGVVSPIGSELDIFWNALLTGKSGIKPITSIDVSNSTIRIGGEIRGFDPRQYLDKKQQKSLRMMARTVQLGVVAAQIAMADAAVPRENLDPLRFGIAFGAGMIATELEDISKAARISTNCQPNSVSLSTWGSSGIKEIPPLWMLKYLPNMPACHISILNDAQGPNNTITESDVASLMAMGEAIRIIQRDLADFILVGGCESKLNPLSLVRHGLFQPLSQRNDDPERALRPFDRDRDGSVLGEGATVLGIEELSYAEKRGAKIYAEIAGFASGFDRAKNGVVMARVIHRALSQAGITPDQVDHVNAHGTGVRDLDIWEAKAIYDVFHTVRPVVPVIAPKSYFGHLGAGAGVMELLVSAEALRRGILPGTLNYETPDPECPVPVHAGEPRPVTRPYALKIGFTDMGQCAAVVLRRWQ